MKKRYIIVVEDDPEIAGLHRDFLQSAGYDVVLLADGNDVIQQVKAVCPVLVLLDVMLPGADGLSLCREIKALDDIPVILVTARTEEVDRLLGLELGADDYICKPFSPREVVARIKNVLRRYHKVAHAAPSPVRVDKDKLKLTIADVLVNLTAVEFQLFYLLYQEQGRVYSRAQIMDAIYDDYRVVNDRTVDSHIKKIRKKIAQVYKDGELIHSVYGAGYRYEELL